jgi:hypothetical protein
MRYGWPRRLSLNFSKNSLYVISVTQPARGTATPLFDVFTGTKGRPQVRVAGFGLESAQYSTFPAKINDLQALPGAFGRIPALQLSQ